MDHLGAIALLLLCAASCSSLQPPISVGHSAAPEVAFAVPPLRTLRSRTPLDPVMLEAFQVVGGRGAHRRQQLWATVGHVSLVRVGPHRRRRVFRRVDGGGFSATLLLGSAADFRALAEAANWRGVGSGSRVSECQFVRLGLTQLTCTTVLHLRGGFQLTVGGSAIDLQAGRATTVVRFPLPGGLLSEGALSDLETRGELACRLSILGTNGSEAYSSTARLQASEALDQTTELTAGGCDSHPAVNLVAAYNFRSQWHAENLVAAGRYRVTARGRANFTADGAELPGHSWLEIDTEGGSLTEHVKYGSQWSVFFMYKRPTTASPRQRASLFSVHRAGNPLACSVLAWTSGLGQASVYSRVHNLADGYATGERTTPELDIRPGAWNRVGVSFDGARQATVINGAEAHAEAVYRLPSYTNFTPDGLRSALSVGLVRGPVHAMLGTFRCFGVTRGFVRPEAYDGLFDQYCQ